MKKTLVKTLIVLLVAALTAALFAGCGEDGSSSIPGGTLSEEPPTSDNEEPPADDPEGGSEDSTVSYLRVNAEGETDENGSYILFGSYPQSRVKDDGLSSALTAAAGDTSGWTSYGYYINHEKSDFMVYKDVTQDGEKYRGVYFSQYRPDEPWEDHSARRCQEDNGYESGSIYWFKFEPIKWSILDESEGDLFLLADKSLDSQAFDGDKLYMNNYKDSEIRQWLNDTFCNTAFSGEQQELIRETVVDNSAASAGGDDNPYICEDTNDRIFLLSFSEATNPSYGFDADDGAKYGARVRSASAYARCQGAYIGGSAAFWWLRSPGFIQSDNAYYVTFNGRIYNFGCVAHNYLGVAPALHLTVG